MDLQRRTTLKGGAAAVAGALTGGPFAGLLASAGSRGPAAPNRGLRAIPDLRDGAGAAAPARGLQYRSFHDTEFAGRPRRRHHACPAATTAWAPSRARTATSSWSATTRSPTARPRPRSGPARRTTPRPVPARTTIEVTKYGEVVDAFTSLNGTMFNCSGGVHAVGLVDHLRGDDQRSRRRPRLPGRAQHRAAAEARLRLRGAGRTARATASRSPARGASRTRRSPSTRWTAILYLTEDNFEFPSGFYRYIPKNNPMETGYLDNEGRLQMLAIKGQPNAHLEARQPKRATYGVTWVDIDDPDPTMPRRHHQRPGAGEGRRPGPRPGCGAVLPARGPGLRRRRRLLHLHPGRRRRRAGLGADRTTTTTTPAASARATARSGPTTPARRSCRCSTRRPVDDAEANQHLRLPRQHHHQPRGHPRRVRGLHGRQLHPRPLARRPAVGHRAQPAGQPARTGRRRGTATSSPGRRSAPTATPSSSTSRPAAA